MPSIVMANSMAPVFPVISGVGWVSMPLIIAIEAEYYANKNINNPIKLAIYSNIASAIVGLLLALVTFPLMVGPAIEAYIEVIYPGALISFVAIGFHWWLSSTVEHRFSVKHKLWKNLDLPKALFYKANSFTYGLILVLFLVNVIRLLNEYYTKI